MHTLWRWWWVVLLVGASCDSENRPVPAESSPANTSLASKDRAGDSESLVSASARAAKRSSTKPGGKLEGPYWPRFHGPDGRNCSPDTGLLKTWPKEGPKLLWTAKGLGHGYATVTLAEGLIFTCGNINEQTVITALDLEGKMQWQQPNGAAWTGEHPGTRGTPTYDESRLYHESPLGELVCMEANTGKRIWGRNILQDFEAENITWALAESVLVDGDRVICCPGGKKGAVVALDKDTGKVVWASPGVGCSASYASPMLAEHQGLRMILTMNQKGLLAVDADTGQFLFDYPHKTDWDVNAFSPLYHEGHIFFSTGYRAGAIMLKVVAQGKKVRVEKVWESKDLDNHHGGVVLVDGYLYGSAHNGPWVCLDWKTGKTQWKERGVGKGSLTWADGMLYCLSEQRRVGLVRATPQRLELVSEFTLPSGGEGPSWAHPVVCGGRFYLRHSDTLYAYEVRAAQPQ